MKYIDRNQDAWRPVGGEDGPMVSITPAPGQLLTLQQWHAIRAQWPAGMAVGLAVPNDTDIEDIEADIERFAMIALHFPKWTDGRAYSQARLLRTRLGYRGEVRATGEVVVDMLPLLARTGFDAVLLRAGESREAAERALRFFPAHYQGDVRDSRPLFALPPGAADQLAREPVVEFTDPGAAI
jgi:uncharacterized protein (DUF934 family)